MRTFQSAGVQVPRAVLAVLAGAALSSAVAGAYAFGATLQAPARQPGPPWPKP